MWDAVNPHTGKRRIDEAFPQELRKSTREQEMMITFKNGSTFQLVGSDNFNSLVGSPPLGLVFSEYALSNPSSWAYLMPILEENGGWALFNSTPRGNNHFKALCKFAEKEPGWFYQALTADETEIFTQDQLQSILRELQAQHGPDFGRAIWMQEYYVSFDAAIPGSILGRWMERAERQGRITDEVEYDEEGGGIEISSDIGRHDTATWWFWQPKMGGFSLVDYDEDTGLAAEEWCERLGKRLTERGYKLEKIWLPHDARSKTFAAKLSPQETFWQFFGMGKVEIVPMTSKADRINAARQIVDRCEFHETNCEKGLEALKAWIFEWDEERREFSAEPRHDWASHPSDGFSYGAQVMRERVAKDLPQPVKYAVQDMKFNLTFNQALERNRARRLSTEA